MTEALSPLAHVPGVFSHYSPDTGSALVTKVHQHARALEQAGGCAYVMVNERRKADYPEGTVVSFSSPRAGKKEWLTKGERRADAVLGELVGKRPLVARYWAPALSAVPGDAAAVVIYNQPSALDGGALRECPGLKVLHLGNDPFGSWSARRLAAVIDRFDLVVAVSRFTADAINARLRRPARQVEVLHNGVDATQFFPTPERPPGTPQILFVGNMVPHKGAHNLIRAAQILADQNVDFTVRIVGSWGLSRWDRLTDYERELRALAGPLGDRVRFEPFADRTKIADIYRQASVFCMPVEWDEPAGQVVTEAMASGLPVVAAPRGGIPEYLGPDGVYVDPTDAKALARALRPLVSDPEAARDLGDILRQQATAMSWERRMWEFDHLLKEVVG